MVSRLLDENTANIEKAKSRRSACGTDANPRNTPRWATVMRKLNLPKRESSPRLPHRV